MNYNVLFLLLLGCFAQAQVPYFNVQFDYENRLETSGKSTIETDSSFLIPILCGTPWVSIPDTGFILKINKYTANISYYKIGLFSGQSADNLIKSKKNGKYVLHGKKYVSLNGTFTDAENYFLFVNEHSLDSTNIGLFGFPGRNDNFYRPIPTADGGIFSSGWSWKIDLTSYQSIILFKCDSNLNQQFLKLYPANPTGNHYGAGLIETPDKGIIIVGNKRVGNYNSNGLIFKVDAIGEIVWWKEIPFIGDTTYLSFQDIVRKNDGTYIVCGIRTFDPQVGPGHETFWLLNVDGNGNILWSKEHNPNFYSGWQTITPSLDGNYYACGVATTYDNSGQQSGYVQHAVISKFSPEGDLFWHRKYTISPTYKLYDIFFNVIATSDGGILCNGSTYENDSTYQNAWIVKLDGNGCLNPNCTTATIEPDFPIGANSWVRISPNPTSGRIHVSALEGRQISALRVFDTSGRLLQNLQDLKASELELDLGQGHAGVYIVSVLVDGVWNVRQVVKTR